MVVCDYLINFLTTAPRRARSTPRASQPKKKKAATDTVSKSGRSRKAPDRYGEDSEEGDEDDFVYPITLFIYLFIYY
jgi:hypothetical protein